MTNPFQIINAFKHGNPEQMAMSMLQQNSKNNPMLQNVLQMAQGKNSAGIEQFARNLCKSKGIDADAMFNQISQMMK